MNIIKYWADCALLESAKIMNTECEKIDLPEITTAFTDYPGLDKTARLFALTANPTHKGYGGQGLLQICSIADKNRINLRVTFTDESLEQFYRSFGFKLVHPKEMERIAQI